MRILIVFIAFFTIIGYSYASYASGVNKLNPYYDSPQIKRILQKDYPKFIKINKAGDLSIKKHMTEKQKKALVKKIEAKYHINIFKFIAQIKKSESNKLGKSYAKLAYNNFKKRQPQIKKFENNILYQNHIMVSELMRKSVPAGQILTSQYLYIFMSSSVPLSVWRIYAKDINKMKQNHIVMVLRGCIDGCQNFTKTFNFANKVLNNHGVKLLAPIEIDPYLFQYYGVKRVPEFVFARHVELYDSSVTAGDIQNIKSKPVSYSVLGDWSLNYVLSKLYKESKDDKLIELDNILNRSWFYNGDR
ncbi:MAG: TrbC family F-type conjugative pilus assembly protein [bacterium]